MNALAADMVGPVLVVGGYGYRNSGDEAMLAGLLELLRGKSVTVVSRTPSETEALHHVRAVSVGRALPELARHRTILVGGGGLFGRDMGRLGRLLPLYLLIAETMRRDVVVEAIGLDEPPSPLVRRALAGARRVTVRDGRSLQLVEDAGLRARLVEDLSSSMPEVPAAVGRDLLRQAGVQGSRRVVGLCLTAIDPALARRVSAAVGAAMDARPDLDFVFIPMSRHPVVPSHDDLVLAAELRSKHPQLHVIDGTPHPAALLSVFCAVDVAICMRFHSLLFAERAGTPMIPFAYAPKCGTWLAERRRSSLEPTAELLIAVLGEMLDEQQVAV